MAEIVLQNELCDACGADVREEALFCFNCGGPVAGQEPEVKHDGHESAENDVVIAPGKKTRLAGQADEAAKVGPDNDRSIPDPFLSKKDSEVEPDGIAAALAATAKKNRDSKMTTSAGNLRNRARNLEPHRIEIIWEEHENAPNVWFVAATVALSILFVVIFLAAMYLR